MSDDPRNDRMVPFHRKVELARTALNEGNADKAVTLFSEIPPDYPWNARELVSKSRAIQLANSNLSLTLEEAEVCLRRAVALEPKDPIVAMELAFFESRVMDETSRAEPRFAQAALMLSKMLGECLGGLLEAKGVDETDEAFQDAFSQLIRNAESEITSAVKRTLGSGQ